MDRLLRILFALLVAFSVTGAELRLPQESVRMDMDCVPNADGTCPCGMPMPGEPSPQRGPQPCSIPAPSSLVVPTRRVTAVIECATAADRSTQEPRPWPVAYTLLPKFQEARRSAAETLPVDTGPPPLASERVVQLRVFRI